MITEEENKQNDFKLITYKKNEDENNGITNIR